ncbi:MAG: hypothetical protein IKT08_02940 [Bacteroidales bacterium]|nr:hypothetical protein [Bacteroidales bacterium]
MEEVSSSAESLLANAKEFISRLFPIEEDILDLPQQIAAKKKKKVVVCIDEFQQIGEFPDTVKFQKIANEEWKKFIVTRFKDTGKTITAETAGYLAEQVENHPYYVQQLAQYAWLRTKKTCTEEIVDSALQAMLYSLNLQFVNLMDSLTEKQRNFLCAISEGVKNLTSGETLHQYRMGTSANIRIIKNALLKRNLIDVTGKNIQIQDPLLKRWIIEEYSKIG